MKRIYLGTIAILIFLVIPSSGDPVEQFWGRSSQAKLVEITEFLKEIGDKYDCHFTIEVALESGNINNSIEKKKIAARLQKNSLRDELEQLNRLVPKFVYKLDKDNPKIIYISDARLLSEPDYPMRKIVTDINFEGNLFDLVNAIGQKGIPISSGGLVDLRDNMSIDFSTRVKVKESGKSVRNLLTNSISVKNRPRILWISRTELGKGAMTYIRYLK